MEHCKSIVRPDLSQIKRALPGTNTLAYFASLAMTVKRFKNVGTRVAARTLLLSQFISREDSCNNKDKLMCFVNKNYF